MNGDMLKGIRVFVNYVDEAPRCALCAYYKEEEDHFLERSWNDVCTMPGELGTMPVNKFGSCNKFKKK
jgi:hypothetical protein